METTLETDVVDRAALRAEQNQAYTARLASLGSGHIKMLAQRAQVEGHGAWADEAVIAAQPYKIPTRVAVPKFARRIELPGKQSGAIAGATFRACGPSYFSETSTRRDFGSSPLRLASILAGFSINTRPAAMPEAASESRTASARLLARSWLAARSPAAEV